MGLSVAELSLIEQRVANDGPSTGTAYLLWLFTGIVSGHRWYLGRGKTAILQILSFFVLIGFVWLLIDGILIPGMIREDRERIRKDMMLKMLAAQNPETIKPFPGRSGAAQSEITETA